MTQFSLDKGYLENFERIGVAFSGGLDSSVLLKFLSDYPEYQKKLVALHVNHGVNKESDYWEQFCKEKATKLNVEFKSWRLGELKKTSEQALREKRYEAFQE